MKSHRRNLAMDKAAAPIDVMDAAFNASEHPRAPDGRFSIGSEVSSGALEKADSDRLSDGHSVQEASYEFSKMMKEAFPGSDVHLSHSATPAGDSSYITVRILEDKDRFAGRKDKWEKAKGTKRGLEPRRKVSNLEYRISDHDTGVRRGTDYQGHLKPDANAGQVKNLIEKAKNGMRESGAMDDTMAQDRIALVFDRANSVRRIDQDGRLHVAVSNISKANICPYKGKEIPGWEALGLDKDKVYKMFRAPEELGDPATVESANNIQLMSSHVAVDAWNPKEQHVAGSTGTDAQFVAPYLRNSLVIWRQIDIDDVNDRDRCELSCAYHYEPDMKSGNHEGEAYDGVMRKIRFNHVALVEEGRAGHDVLVADSKEKTSMNPAALATRALSIASLVGYIQPRLAQDAKVKIAPVFDGIPVGKKFDAKLVAKRLAPILKGKLATDASMGQIAELLDMIDSHEGAVEGDESVSKEQHGAMEAAAHGQSKLGIPQKVGKEFEKADKGKSFDAAEWMRGKGMSEDDIAEFEAASKEAEDEDPDGEGVKAEGEEEEPEAHEETVDKRARDKAARDKAARDKAARARGARDEPHPFRGKPEVGGGKTGEDRRRARDDEAVSKGAMDAALRTQEKLITANFMRTQREVQDALRDVRPLVGDMNVTFDSANAVYRAVLETRGKIDGAELQNVPLPALKRMVGLLRSSEAASWHEDGETLAADSATLSDLEKRIPGISSIRRLS